MQHLYDCPHIVSIESLYRWLADTAMRRHEGCRFTLASEPIGDVDGHHQFEVLRSIVFLEIDPVFAECVLGRCSGQHRYRRFPDAEWNHDSRAALITPPPVSTVCPE